MLELTKSNAFITKDSPCTSRGRQRLEETNRAAQASNGQSSVSEQEAEWIPEPIEPMKCC